MVERAAYLCLKRGGCIGYVLMWDPETGLFQRVEGSQVFGTWHKADEASRFLRADV
jgi:hypothetical protein